MARDTKPLLQPNEQGSSSLFHGVPEGLKNARRGGSQSQNTAVGSTAHPVKGMIPIESSAPPDPLFVRGKLGSNKPLGYDDAGRENVDLAVKQAGNSKSTP